MDDNVEDCPVCMMIFDDTPRRPRTLPCGHTFCTSCILGVMRQGQVECPTCRVGHAVPESGHFPVSYTIEALIRRLRGSALSSTPPRDRKDTVASAGTGPGQKKPAGQIQSLLQEQEAKVLAAIRTCHAAQAQLDQYLQTLAGWGERQQHLEERLQGLVNQSRSARVLVGYEESRGAARKEVVQQGEQQLYALLQALYTVTTEQEIGVVSVDVARCTEEETQKAEECRVMFPDEDAVTTITRVREASIAALDAATTAQAAQGTAATIAGAAAGDSGLLVTPASIMDRLGVLPPPPLKVEDLGFLTQPAKNMLQAGLVFAVHHVGGRKRHSRISLKHGRQFLHSLQDQPPPPDAFITQMDEVVPAAPPCLVFLDLAWPGSEQRRVLIRLSPDTPLGRQFLLLCTGQRGACYAKSRLWHVRDKGRRGERVYGGDYEGNDGTGGAALLPGLDDGTYRKSGQAGSVWGLWWGDDAWGALFGIVTKDWPGYSVSHVFGEVVEGLEGVAAAVQHSPIKEVTVVDCGVVLWTWST